MSAPPSAIAQVLGPAFERLSPEVRAAHSGESLILAGYAQAEVGSGRLNALVRLLFGLPRPGWNIPVTVAFATDRNGIDNWKRNFAGRTYSSRLIAGTGRRAGLLVERQNILTNIFALSVGPDRLVLQLTGFALFGVPLPRFLSPRCIAFETGSAGTFTFDIVVDLPAIGRLIHYRGTLEMPDGRGYSSASDDG
jgi:hypothetical protein